jgi:hypothetical protein
MGITSSSSNQKRARSMEHEGQADFGLADMLILQMVGIEDDVGTPSG